MLLAIVLFFLKASRQDAQTSAQMTFVMLNKNLFESIKYSYDAKIMKITQGELEMKKIAPDECQILFLSYRKIIITSCCI